MTRSALFTKHIPLAGAIASGFYLPGADADDVRQEALIGLWIATGSFEPERGVHFAVFARLVITRRLVTMVKAAHREKHRPLNEAVRVAWVDNEEVAIVETLPGGRDPFEIVVGRQAFDRVVAAIGELSELERESLMAVVNGAKQDEKRIDNAVHRARRKLRAA